MKKLLIALLALSVAGATVSAADPALKVSGYVGAGAVIGMGTDIGGPGVDSWYMSYSDDYDDGAGTWGTITTEYKGETSGFKVVLAADSGTPQSILDTAYGWASPMAGLKLFAGTGYNDAFDGVDDDSNDYFGNESLSATYSVSGLTLGAGMVLDPAGSEKASWAFGAAYEMEGLKVRFSAETVEDEFDNMAASAKYTGIDKLTLSGGYLAENMMDTVAAPLNNWLDFTAKYQVNEKLYAQVVVYDYLEKEYFDIAPRVGYQVSDKLLVYGQLSYETEGKTEAINAATMQPRAYMEFAFDDVSTFYAQYEYDTDAETSGKIGRASCRVRVSIDV